MAVLGEYDGGWFGWRTVCRYLPFPAGLRLVARLVSVFHQGGLAGVCHLPFQRLRNGCDTRECEGVASLVVRWRVFGWLRVWLRGRPCVPMLPRCHLPEARKLAESNPPRCGSRCLPSSVLVIFFIRFGSRRITCTVQWSLPVARKAWHLCIVRCAASNFWIVSGSALSAWCGAAQYSREAHAAGLIPHGGWWYCKALLVNWICFSSAVH